MIRRKSDALKPKKQCDYHDQMRAERDNQDTHEQRQRRDPRHDPAADCWCCCDDCVDLTWYYTPRKGIWWVRTPNGGLQSMRETCDGSPGLPVTKPF